MTRASKFRWPSAGDNSNPKVCRVVSGTVTATNSQDCPFGLRVRIDFPGGDGYAIATLPTEDLQRIINKDSQAPVVSGRQIGPGVWVIWSNRYITPDWNNEYSHLELKGSLCD